MRATGGNCQLILHLSLLKYSREGFYLQITIQSVLREELAVSSMVSPHYPPSSSGCLASQEGREMNSLSTPTGHQVLLNTGFHFVMQAHHPSD